jgi:hypothetical protein
MGSIFAATLFFLCNMDEFLDVVNDIKEQGPGKYLLNRLF